MASNTQKLKRTRAKKLRKSGKERKRQIRINGSTPAFAIHKDASESSETE